MSPVLSPSTLESQPITCSRALKKAGDYFWPGLLLARDTGHPLICILTTQNVVSVTERDRTRDREDRHENMLAKLFQNR